MAEPAPLTTDERDALLDADRCIGHHCGRTDKHHNAARTVIQRLLASPATTVKIVGIGPEWTAILVQALDYWNLDLSAPHMQIREIREALTGTVTS